MIHTDFEKGFICAEVMRFDDFKDPWVVLQQIPEPGTHVAKGASIELVRNEGD